MTSSRNKIFAEPTTTPLISIRSEIFRNFFGEGRRIIIPTKTSNLIEEEEVIITSKINKV